MPREQDLAVLLPGVPRAEDKGWIKAATQHIILGKEQMP